MAGAVQDKGTFPGIARTLTALALLAERAAGRSFTIRFLVLVLLGRAEAIARAYVAREIEPCGWGLDLTPFDEPPGMRFGAAGAELLAQRLRMLATILGALADADADADADAAAAGWSDTASVSDSTGWSAGRAPLPNGGPHLPVLLVIRLPARRHFRLHDTS